jgi:tetratricopeptide (TPR) repeat protein
MMHRCALAVVLALVPTAARAQTPDAGVGTAAEAEVGVEPVADGEARELFERGVEAFDAERYDEALALFLESHALRPSPLVLYNIAVAERRLGRLGDAIAHLEQYLAGAEPGDARRELILAELEELRRLAAPPPETVASRAPDDEPVERRPEPRIEVVPPPRPRPDRDEDDTIWESPWTWIVAGLVLAGGGVTAWLLLRDEPESIEGTFDPPVVTALH